LDFFTQRVNKSARQKSNTNPEFIEDLPTGAILTAECRFNMEIQPQKPPKPAGIDFV
jgi:hypothetical protein